MMMKTLLTLVLLLIFASPALAFNTQGCGSGKCTDCHSLSKKEAGTLLKGGVDRVLSVRPSEIPGLWEVEAERGGKKFPVYVDFSKKYVIAGNIIRLKDHMNVTSERQAEYNRVDVSKIPLDDALVLGNPKAKKRVIVFTDPKCPYCKRLHAELKKVVAEDSNVVFYLKMFPLKIHPTAYATAESIVCNKSLKMLEDSFADKYVPPPLCETKAVDENLALGKKLGIHATPTLIFPDGRIMPGYKTAAQVLELLGEPAKGTSTKSPSAKK
jgi:thiol:disulfide interchange protein DsbC